MTQCGHCKLAFEISEKEREFLCRVSPKIASESLSLSSPTLCPACRDRNRLAWRNDRTLYSRKCSKCTKGIVSCYNGLYPAPIYCSQCWLSDGWDPLDSGEPFDPARPFLDQFSELLSRIPHLALYNINPENSDYCNHAADMKDCYLVFASAWNERTLYATRSCNNNNSVDLVESDKNEFCYSVLDCQRCHNLQESTHCVNCADSYFLFACQGCHDCCGSANLRNARYVWFNEQLSKEAYQERLAKARLDTRTGRERIREQALSHLVQQPHRFATLTACENSTGDQLIHCKNCVQCFNISEAEDCAYCELGVAPKDSYDASGISGGELCYGIMNHVSSSRTISSCVTYYNDECYYSYHCQSCRDVLGCVGLRHKQYCILNRQYSRDEYERVFSAIARQMQEAGIWGAFFPGALSPFGYNETEAQSVFPSSKEDITAIGYRWVELENRPPSAAMTIAASDLPDEIRQVADGILECAIRCDATGKPFKIMKSELEFYRRNGIPVPAYHPDERYRRMLARRNSRKLFKRECSKCSSNIETGYSPERPEVILCEACYNAHVY